MTKPKIQLLPICSPSVTICPSPKEFSTHWPPAHYSVFMFLFVYPRKENPQLTLLTFLYPHLSIPKTRILIKVTCCRHSYGHPKKENPQTTDFIQTPLFFCSYLFISRARILSTLAFCRLLCSGILICTSQESKSSIHWSHADFLVLMFLLGRPKKENPHHSGLLQTPLFLCSSSSIPRNKTLNTASEQPFSPCYFPVSGGEGSKGKGRAPVSASRRARDALPPRIVFAAPQEVTGAFQGGRKEVQKTEKTICYI